MNVDRTLVMWLADHSIRAAALILLVGVGCVLARRSSAQSRLFAWTVVLYMAVAMPLLAVVLPELLVPVVLSDLVIVVPAGDSIVAAPLRQAAESFPSTRSSSTLPWLLAIYLAGMGFLITRLIAGAHLSGRVLRRARPVDDATVMAEVRAMSAAMNLPRVPHVVEHHSVHVPFVCGVFRPALVLPDAWRSWNAATRRAVLTHELSHIVRRDLWTMRAALLYCAATWMNPLSWWLRRTLETLAERASDDEVLASGVEPTAYAEVLVQFFGAAQRAPGRATWRLAMARRSGAEARKRVGRVLNAREGGPMTFGMPGRVLVGIGVVLAAVPVMVLSATQVDAIAIQAPPIVSRGRDLRQAQATPSRSRGETRAALRAVPATRQPSVAESQEQAQEQEPEPWRSTRKASDADVVTPTLSHAENPKYTPDALRARVQGWVTVEAIVSPEGEVTAARVTRSLDREFGLDDEALKVARQWQFRPGTYQGQPVAVRVIIELEFRLHR